MARYLSAPEMVAMFPGNEFPQALGAARVQDGSWQFDMARLELYIDMAENEADAYIATQYALPLKSVPPVLKQMIADMARYRAYNEKATQVVQKRYDDAIAFMKSVAHGRTLLGVPQQDTVAPRASLPTFSAGPSVFSSGGKFDDF